MDLGVSYSSFSHPDWQRTLTKRLADTVRIADQGGVDLVAVMDHYFQMPPFGGPGEPMVEGYTTLGYLAGITERTRLSMLVTGVTYRHPGLLAKIVTTLDVLSGGRAVLALGAAWYDREHAGLGVPFPPLSDRFEMLEETILIARQMWSDDDGPFDGKHFQLQETIGVPKPMAGAIPILIGGGGEKKTLRLVAQYADACHLFVREGAEGLAHKLDVLRRHCDDVGRDYESIAKTVDAGGALDPISQTDDFLRLMERCSDLGATLVTATLVPGIDDPAAYTAELVERVLPRLKQV